MKSYFSEAIFWFEIDFPFMYVIINEIWLKEIWVRIGLVQRSASYGWKLASTLELVCFIPFPRNVLGLLSEAHWPWEFCLRQVSSKIHLPTGSLLFIFLQSYLQTSTRPSYLFILLNLEQWQAQWQMQFFMKHFCQQYAGFLFVTAKRVDFYSCQSEASLAKKIPICWQRTTALFLTSQ